MSVEIFYESTPNPLSLKFVVTQPIAEETIHFADAAGTGRSPLAKKLFSFPWAAGVMIGPNFVTVTKQEWVDWAVLADPLSGLIKEHIERGEPVLFKSTEDAPDADHANDSAPVRLIKKILREEIRPAVAMDGGDIAFDRFENGQVFLHLRGACAGCPSSQMTLKDGIETRLREAVPEVREVVQVV